jgi:hypothetical protein
MVVVNGGGLASCRTDGIWEVRGSDDRLIFGRIAGKEVCWDAYVRIWDFMTFSYPHRNSAYHLHW